MLQTAPLIDTRNVKFPLVPASICLTANAVFWCSCLNKRIFAHWSSLLWWVLANFVCDQPDLMGSCFYISLHRKHTTLVNFISGEFCRSHCPSVSGRDWAHTGCHRVPVHIDVSDWIFLDELKQATMGVQPSISNLEAFKPLFTPSFVMQ